MSREDDVKQAIAYVAKIGGFAVKKMVTADDLKDHSITITITRASDGWHQDRLPFEDEVPLVATVDGNGHVERVEGAAPTELQPGDTAETGAEADAERAAAASKPSGGESDPLPRAQDPDDAGEQGEPLRDPAQPFVGELAASAKQNRKQR